MKSSDITHTIPLSRCLFFASEHKLIVSSVASEVRAAPGGKWANFFLNSRENSDCKFHMCLRAIKTKHYSQRIHIVGLTAITLRLTLYTDL